MNEEAGEPQQQDADEKSKSSATPIPTTDAREPENCGPESTEPRKEPASHQVTRWNRFKEWAAKISVAEVGMLFLTFAIAASSFFYTKYAKRQWKVMSHQLEQMQADSRTSDQHFQDTLGEMRKQSTALGTIATAAGNIKSPVVGNSSKPILVRGPQMGVDRFNIGADHPGQDVKLGEIAPNAPLTANAVIKNFGQSPLQLDELGVKLEIRSSPVPENFQYGSTPHRNQMTIFSGQEFFTPNASSIVVDPEDFSEIKVPKHNGKVLVFHGFVKYHDASRGHTAKFCFIWTGVDRLMNNCLEHNGTE
jgi:hypothetical protein